MDFLTASGHSANVLPWSRSLSTLDCQKTAARDVYTTSSTLPAALPYQPPFGAFKALRPKARSLCIKWPEGFLQATRIPTAWSGA